MSTNNCSDRVVVGSSDRAAKVQSHRFSVAPMMDWSDRHCRFFHRLMTRHALLYTEMVTAEAILHGKRDQLLGFDPAEHPVALQLGGSDPHRLAQAAAIGADYGYDEINLNCGCPSDRVQNGRFGACLMAEPNVVADCVSAMRARVGVPVTVKCRIGIDDQDSEVDFQRFIDVVADAGCRLFVVHARKAWLKGLSPKENRDIPPLDYARVRRLKAARPDLTIVINGGIGSLAEAEALLAPDNGVALDGVMLGRAAYQTPWLLADVDRRIFGAAGHEETRDAVLERLMPYIKMHLARGGRLNNITRHVLGLYHAAPNARRFRRHLGEKAAKAGAGTEVLRDAIEIAAGREAAVSHAA